MARVPDPEYPLGSVNFVAEDGNGDREFEVCLIPTDEILRQRDESVEQVAVLALDASASMMEAYNYGRPEIFGGRNWVQAVGRKIGQVLAQQWSTSRNVNFVYWAAGPEGKEVHEIGGFPEDQCSNVDIPGPPQHRWGTSTRLLPVIRHIVETVGGITGSVRVGPQTSRMLGVVQTDGCIEDEKACIDYCNQLGQQLVDSGQPKKLKLVLIGVGKEVDVKQLDRFDNMFERTSLRGKIDLWSCGVASDWTKEHQIEGAIFGELWDEDQIAVHGKSEVFDGNGSEARTKPNSFGDGLTGKFRLWLPKDHTSFTVRTPTFEVTQDVSRALRPES